MNVVGIEYKQVCCCLLGNTNLYVFGGFRAYAWSVGVMDSKLPLPSVVPISYQIGAVAASSTSSLPWLRGTKRILSDHQNWPAGECT